MVLTLKRQLNLEKTGDQPVHGSGHNTFTPTRLGLSRSRQTRRQQHQIQCGEPARLPRSADTVEVWSHLVVADGVEVILEPARAGLGPEQVRAFFRNVQQAYEVLKAKEGKR